MLQIPLFLLLALAQQKPPEAPPPLPGGTTSSGAPAASTLKPGELPAAASPEARAAWERVCAASVVAGTQRVPVDSFELLLDVRYRGDRASSDVGEARYRFKKPALVRVRTTAGKKEVGRGAAGDWLHDDARQETVLTSVGREYAEDRRQLDEWSGVGQNFVALTDPRALRIGALEVLKAAPASIPQRLAKRAGELSWLCVRSPDFRLLGANPASGIFRASLGFDPKSGWVELALVEEDVADAVLRPTARLVEMQEPVDTQGFRTPRKIFVYSVAEGRAPAAFAVPAGMDLFVTSANLRANLAPKDFDPPPAR
ncbi:MAG TPA: hypothetical protein VGR31_15420 [Planctomycetota bacterium]|jgi:hypothetical protein|nr:hypothetical protein [Planctomycetota bacterium]